MCACLSTVGSLGVLSLTSDFSSTTAGSVLLVGDIRELVDDKIL